MKSLVQRAVDTAARVEGEPYYALQQVRISGRELQFRCYEALPPCDAVGLLGGDDHTGLIAWEGTLRLLQWVYETGTATQQFSAVVELGCGCGLAAAGVARDVRAAEANTTLILATDANVDCVSLAQRNLDACGSAAQALVYSWGEASTSSCLLTTLQQHVENAAVGSTVLVISGDVIYDMAAVEPLFAAVRDISTVCPAGVLWLLQYIPRSLTRESNRKIFAAILDAFAAPTFVTVRVYPLPADGAIEKDWWSGDGLPLHEAARQCGDGCLFSALLTHPR